MLLNPLGLHLKSQSYGHLRTHYQIASLSQQRARRAFRPGTLAKHSVSSLDSNRRLKQLSPITCVEHRTCPAWSPETPPKFNEKTPRETEKERNGGGRGEKKESEILGGLEEGGLAYGGLGQGGPGIRTNNNHNNQAFDPKLPSRLCVSFLIKTLAGDDGFRCSRLWKLRSEAEKGAPAPLMAATRADDRAHGVGRSPAPLFVPRCRARDVRRSTEPDDAQLQGRFGVLRLVRRGHRRGSA